MPHTALSLLKLKSELHNSKLDSVEKDTDEQILNSEELKIFMMKFCLKSDITNKDFIIHILNLHEEYDISLYGLENHLMTSVHNTLTIEVTHKNTSQA